MHALGGGLLILFMLYLLDLSYWKNCWKVLKNILWWLLCCWWTSVFGPWPAPTTIALICLLHVCSGIFCSMQTVFLKICMNHFLAAVGATYFTAGLVSLVVWLIWQENFASSWTEARLILNDRLYCTPYIKYDMARRRIHVVRNQHRFVQPLIILKTALAQSFHPTTHKQRVVKQYRVRVWSPLTKKIQHVNWGL